MAPSTNPVLDYAGDTISRRRPRRFLRLLLILANIYLPYGWLLYTDHWDDYRLHWLKMWPVLPGLTAGLFAIPRDDPIVYGVMSVMTVCVLAVFGLCAWLGNRWVFRVAAIVALLGSAVNSWVAYGVYRS